jgi:hypothetical protein
MADIMSNFVKSKLTPLAASELCKPSALKIIPITSMTARLVIKNKKMRFISNFPKIVNKLKIYADFDTKN